MPDFPYKFNEKRVSDINSETAEKRNNKFFNAVAVIHRVIADFH